MTSNLKENIQETQNIEKQKTSSLKEYVKNADLQKFVLNKIMTMHKQRIKYSFVAPLIT